MKFRHIEPLDFPIYKCLDKQFYLYEFDSDLRILQKVKIPKSIFREFVEKYPNEFFYYYMAFRLNEKEIEFFGKTCGFKKIISHSVVDIFVNAEYCILDFNNNVPAITKPKNSDIEKVKHIIPKEFFPENKNNKNDLEIISKITNKCYIKSVYFIVDKLILSISYADNQNSFIIKDIDSFTKLSSNFTYFHKLNREIAQGILKSNGYDFVIPKNCDDILFGFSRACSDLEFAIALQYEDSFEIFVPNETQAKELIKYFYQPLPNGNLLLYVYHFGKHKYFIPKPKTYCIIFDSEYNILETLYLPLLNIHNLAKIIGQKKIENYIKNGEPFEYIDKHSCISESRNKIGKKPKQIKKPTHSKKAKQLQKLFKINKILAGYNDLIDNSTPKASKSKQQGAKIHNPKKLHLIYQFHISY